MFARLSTTFGEPLLSSGKNFMQSKKIKVEPLSPDNQMRQVELYCRDFEAFGYELP